MQQALACINAGTARLIPVLLRPTDWNISLLGQYRPLPSNGIPISLWSDRDAACTDVVQGIRRIIEELISQETKLTSSTPWQVPVCDPPYTYDDLFTDRETILAAISSFFASTRPHRTSILALSGMGGIGKTAIALEYCYRTSQAYQHILWLNASSRSVLSTYVSLLADRLSLPNAIRQDEQQLFATIKQWLREQPGWLLVLDQIEDMTLIDLLVPPLSSGHALLTTRAQDTRKRASLLSIPSMDINASTLFLLRRIHILPGLATLDQASTDIVREATAIAREMDGFPLALDQAGAYLERWGGDLPTYLTLYRKQRTRLLSERGQVKDDQHEAVTGPSTFVFEQLRGSPYLNLLHLLAFLHPDIIPEGLLVKELPESVWIRQRLSCENHENGWKDAVGL